MEMLFMADLPLNGLHEKVTMCSICYITKSRLDVLYSLLRKSPGKSSTDERKGV